MLLQEPKEKNATSKNIEISFLTSLPKTKRPIAKKNRSSSVTAEELIVKDEKDTKWIVAWCIACAATKKPEQKD